MDPSNSGKTITFVGESYFPSIFSFFYQKSFSRRQLYFLVLFFLFLEDLSLLIPEASSPLDWMVGTYIPCRRCSFSPSLPPLGLTPQA